MAPGTPDGLRQTPMRFSYIPFFRSFEISNSESGAGGRGAVVIFISQNYRKTLIMAIFFPSINATRTLFEEELCCIVSLHSRYSVNIYNSGIWIIDDIVNCTAISICPFTLGSQRWREDLEKSPPISKETFPSSSRNGMKTWGETSCKT